MDLIDEDEIDIATVREEGRHQPHRGPHEVEEAKKSPALDGSRAKPAGVTGIKDRHGGVMRQPIKILSTETKKGSAAVETVSDLDSRRLDQ